MIKCDKDVINFVIEANLVFSNMYFKTKIIKKTGLSIKKFGILSLDMKKWLNAHFNFQCIVALA